MFQLYRTVSSKLVHDPVTVRVSSFKVLNASNPSCSMMPAGTPCSCSALWGNTLIHPLSLPRIPGSRSCEEASSEPPHLCMNTRCRQINSCWLRGLDDPHGSVVEQLWSWTICARPVSRRHMSCDDPDRPVVAQLQSRSSWPHSRGNKLKYL